MPSEPRYRVIYRELLAEIAAGTYATDGKLPSEAQLVERFGVSRPTAARALRDLQDQGLIERRVGSGSYVRAARSTKSDTTAREIGLLIPGLGNTEIFEVICGELASMARVRDYMLLWGGSGNPKLHIESNVAQIEKLCDHYIERPVAGVFFAPFEHTWGQEEVNRRLAERLHQFGIAVVLLDRDLVPFPRRSEFDLVGVDNFGGGYLLVEHLAKLGCQRIQFVTRKHSAPTVDARIAGAREAARVHQIKLPATFVRSGDPDDADFIKSLLAKPRPEAILCANDHTAAVLIRTLNTNGIRVPTDVRVVGFDDVKYATLLSPPLTTVHQPCREIAESAFRAMLERIAEPTIPKRTISLSAALVVRESCGAYLPR